MTRKETLADYYACMREKVEEAQALFSDFLISVTTFFRDPEAFKSLANKVIPQLFDGKEAGDSIRVWVPETPVAFYGHRAGRSVPMRRTSCARSSDSTFGQRSTAPSSGTKRP
ncbi:Chemotaxis protein methyltransferase CheR [Sinorhizobium sp. CCBAU 05631]|nr:Chemotaxis protein methyltransferase CheR [Sinorhizobium sp. CCBAU 05631]